MLGFIRDVLELAAIGGEDAAKRKQEKEARRLVFVAGMFVGMVAEGVCVVVALAFM